MSQETKSPPNTGRITENGPLILHGRIRYSAGEGTPAAEFTQVALCRCGASSNKPFCDGSHARARFADAGRCARPPEAADQASGSDLVLNAISNGPLRVDGWFELATTDGQRFVCGDKTWLCRCGASGNKPFCDGSHRKTGFTA